jgi:hypothetical protein
VLTQPHHTRSPFKTPAPFPDRTLLPKDTTETTDEEPLALLWSLRKLTSLHTAEA